MNSDCPNEPIGQLMAATSLRWREVVSLTWPSLPAPSIHLSKEATS